MAVNPAKIPNKVFVDSSVFIAAAISAKGSARDLLMAGIRHEMPLVVSDHVFEETERNLARKAPRAVGAFQLLQEIVPFEIVHPTQALVEEVAVVIEPKDAVIVAGAIQSAAAFLATYDRKHLLSFKNEIKVRFGIKVVTPDNVINNASRNG